MSQIEIYKTNDGQTQVDVKFEEDTVWLTQKQISELFQTTIPNANMHIINILGEGELEESVIQDFLITAADGKNYRTKHYNLDMIISVGYRINSKHGTQFRQWATQRLKDHLVRGYTINQNRLKQLQKVVEVIEKSGQADNLQLPEAKGLLDILGHYTRSFALLQQYDSNELKTEKLDENVTYEIEYDEARAAIDALKNQLITKKEATAIFGNEKDKGFRSSLQSVVQTFDGQYLYPSIEEQAAHLLYFIIKNHSFSDGNKRIAAFLFMWFLEKNKHRFKDNGEAKINDNGLVALALLVAQSDPADKEPMIKLIINLINN